MVAPQTNMRQSILSYFVRHGTSANLLLVLMVVAGLFAMTKIRSQFFPDIVIERVIVSVGWPGAGPSDVDNGIVAVLEPALLAVEGVVQSDANSVEGRASITLEFESSYDMSQATDDVKAAVDAITTLPENSNEPVVRRGGWRDRVTDVVISGPIAPEQVGRLADEFVARLFRAGISRATIAGFHDPRLRISVSEAALIRHDVSLSEISAAIGAAADANPAGDVQGTSQRVRAGSERRSVEDVANVIVRVGEDGTRLRVRDVADIELEGVERNEAYFIGDDPAVSVRVDRSDQGDAIAMQATVQRIVEDMQTTVPEGVTLRLIRTRAEAISGRLGILMDNGLTGLMLVLGLLFLFLNFRTAFWVAAGIPAAMLATIGLMYAFGLTINMVSLFALIICLGIVVDDAIVVGEHADTLNRRGLSPVEAAEGAAHRMASPVFSASVTTIIAFSALVLVGGRFGDLISAIPFTVSVVLLASLVECFLILPNHMSHALAAQARDAWYDWPSRRFNAGFEWVRETVFRPAVGWVIRLRYPVIAAAILILSFSTSLFLTGDVKWRFFNAPERGSISGNFAMLPGSTREDSLAMMKELQRATLKVGADYEAEFGTNPLDFVMGQIGGTTGRGLSGQDTKSTDELGAIVIELIDADLRPYSSFAFIARLQDEVRRVPLLETLSFRGWRSGPGGDSLEVKLFGSDAETLKAAAELLKEEASAFEVVSALEDTLAYDKEEAILELKPLGESLGFTIDGIGAELYRRLSGVEAAEFPVGTRTGKVIVQLADVDQSADFLAETRLRSPAGQYVPLSDLVTIRMESGFSTIRRENSFRTVKISGDVSEDDPALATAFDAELRDRILPLVAETFNVEYQLGGLAEQENDFVSDALLGFMVCLIGIYLCLAWVFASWTRPVVVMAIIPFGVIGMIWGHYIWNVPLSMFSVVGAIGMTGIIINDSIVLVTTIDEYGRERGLVPSVISAATDRLRPVLLTTLTTVLGLAPLLYESSQQAQFLKPTVITLCYGLGFAVVLVLIIVPALVAIQRDVGGILQTMHRALRPGTRLAIQQRLILGAVTLVSMACILAVAGHYAVTQTAVLQLGALPDGVTTIVLMLSGALLAALLGLVAILAVGRSAIRHGAS